MPGSLVIVYLEEEAQGYEGENGVDEAADPAVEGGAHEARDIGNQKPDVALVLGRQEGFPAFRCLGYDCLAYLLRQIQA